MKTGTSTGTSLAVGAAAVAGIVGLLAWLLSTPKTQAGAVAAADQRRATIMPFPAPVNRSMQPMPPVPAPGTLSNPTVVQIPSGGQMWYLYKFTYRLKARPGVQVDEYFRTNGPALAALARLAQRTGMDAVEKVDTYDEIRPRPALPVAQIMSAPMPAMRR
ncbi:MAG TPA: hypothetical protein VGK74_22200 [Symbiobacteriaceae bacterium]|jgi:hypothetical protein